MYKESMFVAHNCFSFYLFVFPIFQGIEYCFLQIGIEAWRSARDSTGLTPND